MIQTCTRNLQRVDEKHLRCFAFCEIFADVKKNQLERFFVMKRNFIDNLDIREVRSEEIFPTETKENQ